MPGCSMSAWTTTTSTRSESEHVVKHEPTEALFNLAHAIVITAVVLVVLTGAAEIFSELRYVVRRAFERR